MATREGLSVETVEKFQAMQKAVAATNWNAVATYASAILMSADIGVFNRHAVRQLQALLATAYVGLAVELTSDEETYRGYSRRVFEQADATSLEEIEGLASGAVDMESVYTYVFVDDDPSQDDEDDEMDEIDDEDIPFLTD